MNLTVELERDETGLVYTQALAGVGRLQAALSVEGTYDEALICLKKICKGSTIMPSKKNMTKYAMMTLGYAVMNYLQKNLGRDELIWNDYHGFPIAEVPDSWVKDIRKSFGLKKKDYTLQIGKCLKDYSEPDHYHKIGHQLVIALGPHCGFTEPEGTISIGDIVFDAIEDKVYYFNTNIPHGFRGEFYFINIQNPPLVDEEGNDDYYQDTST